MHPRIFVTKGGSESVAYLPTPFYKTKLLNALHHSNFNST
jgi:hypothetical protein